MTRCLLCGAAVAITSQRDQWGDTAWTAACHGRTVRATSARALIDDLGLRAVDAVTAQLLLALKRLPPEVSERPDERAALADLRALLAAPLPTAPTRARLLARAIAVLEERRGPQT